MNVDLNMSVLIIDDHLEMRQIIRNLLKQLGLKNIDQSPGGKIAMEMLHRKKYGLVIADDNMVHLGGLDLIDKICSDRKLRDTPCFLVTGQGKKSEITDPTVSRFFTYIQTPFNVAELKSKLTMLVGNF